MKLWVTKGCGADLQQIADRYHISLIFAEVLVKRGLYNWKDMDEYLFDDMMQLPAASEMYGLICAAELIWQKINEKKKIQVVGDYDVDGVMSAFILCRGLERLGADVSSRIPHRQKDGYGIRTYMVEDAFAGGVDTIITCDNGISAMDAVKKAKELGLTVILTDHHEVPRSDVGEELPPADVIVDPKQERDNYPFRELCGAGIAFKLISYLYEKNSHKEWAEELLPFAAMATVCDVVPLVGENRSIVKRGLEKIKTTDNPGLRALIEQSQFQKEITARDFGFRLGPCVNAPGRLQDATLGFSLFMEKNEEKARKKAENLIELNVERKEITRVAVEEAIQYIEQQGLSKVLVVYMPSCHESVAGIVAGRLREKYYRPVYLVTDSGDHLKGSGRSIPGYHMQQELLACREYLTEFGGHSMAAGFSLPKDNLDSLREALLSHCSLSENDLTEKVYYDKEVSLADLDVALAEQLGWLEPTGEKNPSAVFAKRDAEIFSVRMCGKDMSTAQIRFRENGKQYQAVNFRGEDGVGKAVAKRYGQSAWDELKSGAGGGKYKIDILFSCEINDKYGSLQLRIIDCQ
ncbi:MAG: single-stranded-DNA-specific exonuclease RecJ [Lachnospiraceae bacterium]|nr:single-stranded-DNA-specific exonuclease RecJ [Lachnospiraceae bacterium]